MSRSIWKYALEITDEQKIEVPDGAIPLSVQFQAGSLCLWMLVNPRNKKYWRKVNIFGTGNPVPGAWIGEFVGTAQHEVNGTILVGHAFLEGEEYLSS